MFEDLEDTPDGWSWARDVVTLRPPNRWHMESGGRRLMTITSTYDHRIIQGAVSGEFLRVIDQLLQGEAGFYDAVAAALGVGPVTAERPDGTAERQDGTTAAAAPPSASGVPAVSEGTERLVAAAMSLVRAHRTHGYLCARLDPLGTEPKGDPAVNPGPPELTPDDLPQNRRVRAEPISPTSSRAADSRTSMSAHA